MDLKKLVECLSENELEKLRQILSDKDAGLTDIYRFVEQNRLKLRPSMIPALFHLRERNYERVRYVENITKYDFMKCHNCGIKSWELLLKLRENEK